jgi:hypothetical protein
MRTVILQGTAEDWQRLRDSTTPAEVEHAIAYLSTWALDGYDKATLFINNDHTEVTAIYDNSVHPVPGTRTYVIGAIWHGDHFGFHS